MNRLERALGILLYLRARKTVSSQELARRFEVSTRTIYRDMETLSALGIPIYAEMGREGGFGLVEGYFLPPVMFTIGEAVSLLFGLNSLRRFRAKPYAREIETAEQKLRAAVPDALRETLTHVQQIVGFEEHPVDAFTLERISPTATEPNDLRGESAVLDVFMQAILEHRQVRIHYFSPYRGRHENVVISPEGMLWDRDHWYLVGTRLGKKEKPRMWRADRVHKIQLDSPLRVAARQFDIRNWMGRQWLREAMQEWQHDAPVKLHITSEMAERLQQDWYYRYAQYRHLGENKIEMTFGADKREYVLELVRWLGVGAELIEPHTWRHVLRDELQQMADLYT